MRGGGRGLGGGAAGHLALPAPRRLADTSRGGDPRPGVDHRPLWGVVREMYVDI